MDPMHYMSKSRSSVYTEMPVFLDELTGEERAVPYKDSGEVLEGCLCRTLGRKCPADDGCTCLEREQPSAGNVCALSDCDACNLDVTRCKALPGCLCRRNAIEDDVLFVCNAKCHGRGRGCDNKVCRTALQITPAAHDIHLV